jgi:hypothetical protein
VGRRLEGLAENMLDMRRCLWLEAAAAKLRCSQSGCATLGTGFSIFCTHDKATVVSTLAFSIHLQHSSRAAFDQHGSL